MYTIPTISVLMVDDEPMITRWVGNVLQARGHQVWVVLSYEEFLTTISAPGFEVDVIVFDLNFGSHDGLGIWQSFASKLPNTAWVPCSGHICDETLKRLNMQRQQVLEKPFRAARLLEVVEAAATSRPTSESNANAR